MANKPGNRLTQKTKKALIDSFQELLEHKPIEKIRIKEICEHADISRPTFYSHFQTKEEILVFYLDKIIERMFQEYQRPFLTGITKLDDLNFKRASTNFFKLWDSNRKTYGIIKKHNLEHLIIDKLKEYHLNTYYVIARNVPEISNLRHLNYFISHISYVFFSVLDEFIMNDKETPESAGEILAVLYEPKVIIKMAKTFSEN